MFGLLVVYANRRQRADRVMPGVTAAKNRWIKILPKREIPQFR